LLIYHSFFIIYSPIACRSEQHFKALLWRIFNCRITCLKLPNYMRWKMTEETGKSAKESAEEYLKVTRIALKQAEDQAKAAKKAAEAAARDSQAAIDKADTTAKQYQDSMDKYTALYTQKAEEASRRSEEMLAKYTDLFEKAVKRADDTSRWAKDNCEEAVRQTKEAMLRIEDATRSAKQAAQDSIRTAKEMSDECIRASRDAVSQSDETIDMLKKTADVSVRASESALLKMQENGARIRENVDTNVKNSTKAIIEMNQLSQNSSAEISELINKLQNEIRKAEAMNAQMKHLVDSSNAHLKETVSRVEEVQQNTVQAVKQIQETSHKAADDAKAASAKAVEASRKAAQEVSQTWVGVFKELISSVDTSKQIIAAVTKQTAEKLEAVASEPPVTRPAISPRPAHQPQVVTPEAIKADSAADKTQEETEAVSEENPYYSEPEEKNNRVDFPAKEVNEVTQNRLEYLAKMYAANKARRQNEPGAKETDEDE